MFHVFKIKITMIGAGCLLTSFLLPSVAFSEEVTDSSWNPLEYFHEVERPSAVIESYLVESSESDAKIKVYVINQDEPYNSPLAYRIFIKCHEEGLGELNRVLVDGSLPTYCQSGTPEIMKNRQFFGSDESFLVVPGHSFDDSRGECVLEQETLEVYPMDEVTQACEN